MTLALLLGPQLSAFAAAGYDVVGVSAAGSFVPELERSGISHIALRHATRSVSVLDDVRAATELYRLLANCGPTLCTRILQSPASTGGWVAGRPGCRS